MSLIYMPRDIMAPILEMIELEDLARLFCVGNRALLYRLHLSRFIRTISKVIRPSWLPEDAILKHSKFSCSLFSQLSVLAYFPHIEHLHLDFTGQLVTLDVPTPILGLKLRSLVLKMHDSWELFWDRKTRSARPLNLLWPAMHTLMWADLKTLDHRTCTDDAQKQVGRCLPKSLERLGLGNFARLPSDLIQSLPPGILHLEITVNEVRTHTGAPDLPPRLQSIVLNTEGPSADNFALSSLSPDFYSCIINRGRIYSSDSFTRASLAKLTVLHIPAEHFGADWILKLPRTLTSLHASMGANNNLLAPILNEHLAQLPHGLTYLRMKAPLADCSAFVILPRSLTYLECDYNVISNTLDEAIARMPPNLEVFKYIGSTWPSTETTDFLLAAFPASVRRLTISFRMDTGVIPRANYFPKSLEKLTYRSGVVMRPEDVAKLPRTITSLNVGSANIHEYDARETLDFPPFLKIVKSQHGSLICSDTIRHLPKTLTYLELRHSTVRADHLPHLPPSLTYFYCTCLEVSQIITKGIVAEYESALELLKSGSSLADIRFPTQKSGPDGLFVSISDLFGRMGALLPKGINNIACDSYVLNANAELLAPLGPHLTGLDLVITDWQLYPALPEIKKVDSELEELELTNTPSLAPTNSLPTTATAYKLPRKLIDPSLSDAVFCASTAPELFPRLTSLSMGFISTRGTKIPYCEFGIADLHSLPPTLNKLEIFGYSFNQANPGGFGGDWIKRLPHLEHLKLAMDFLMSGLISDLPSGLHTLIGPLFTIFDFDFSHLPRGLTHLECHSVQHDDEKPQFELLPPSLTRILLEGDNVDIRGPFLSLAQLSSRTNLVGNRAAEKWNKFFASTRAKSLPVPLNITTLALDLMNIQQDFFQVSLPSTITHMSLRGIAIPLTTDSVPFWPQSLTSARFSSLSFTQSLLLLGNPETFPEELPEVAFDWNFIKSQIMLIAPPGLTQLDVDRPGSAAKNDWPSAFLKLRARTWTSIDLPYNTSFDDSCLLMIPSSVKTLRIPKSRALTPFGAQRIPKTITELILSTWNPNNQSIQNLPPNLTKLEFVPLAPAITDACIKNFPRTLVDLNISTTTVLDTSLPDFPHTLKRLKLQKIVLTGKMHRPSPHRPQGSSSEDKKAEQQNDSISTTASTSTADAEAASPEPIDFTYVSFSSLVRSAMEFLGASLESLPTFNFEIEPAEALKNILPEVEHIHIPEASFDTFHVLRPLKPNVAYRVPNTTLVSLPSRPTAYSPITAQMWEYRIADPTVHVMSLKSEKPQSLTVTWKLVTENPLKLKILPKKLKTFTILHARALENEDIAKLPRTLTSLSLPHSTYLTTTCLEDLPRSLTEVNLDISDFVPRVQRLNERTTWESVLAAALPTGLKRATWTSVLYVGEDTESLRRPTAKAEEEEEQMEQ